jgi:hypothetical protein
MVSIPDTNMGNNGYWQLFRVESSNAAHSQGYFDNDVTEGEKIRNL